MNAKQAAALAAIRSAGVFGIGAWRMENGKRVRAFSTQVVTALVEAGAIEIAQDSRRPECSTFYRVKEGN